MNKKIKLLIIILFILSIIFPHVSNMYLTNSIFDDVKYLIVFFNILICFLYLFKIKKTRFLYKIELINVSTVVIAFFFLSIIFGLFFAKQLTSRTIVELLYLLIPALYTFCLINCLELEDILFSMKCILYTCLILWVIEIGIFNFTFDNFIQIDFINSFSPFESFIFADISLTSFCFFLYTKNIDENKCLLSSKVSYYISFLFVLLTFKRIAVLFATLLFILDILIDLRQTIHVNCIRFTKIIFSISVLAYTWLLLGDNSKILYHLFGFDLDKFTVGRQWYLSLIEMKGTTYGPYGSTTLTLESILGTGKYLEMDLVKMTIELSGISSLLFINNYWNLISRNLLSYIIMLMVFVNLLFSHSLTNPFAWTIRLLTFAIITIYIEKGVRTDE